MVENGGRARAFAPGRVNLIGEHTDYSEGLCLPFAIEQGITVTAEPGGAEPDDPFVRGALAELGLPPCRLRIESDLPQRAGLASSAAYSVAVCLALCAAAGAEPPPALELARLCSRVENDWVGQPTGLLDQLACLHGEPEHALRLDMRSLSVEPVALRLDGHVLTTLDSGAPRSLAASGYAERRAECERAAAELGVPSLRDAGVEDAGRLSEPLAGRVRHVASENARVEAMVAALGAGDLGEAGRLLDASHRSLRDDFAASVPEVEAAVERAGEAGALGARMVGGGFGGHVLALFPPESSLPPDALTVRAGPGARLL
ncbi:MAG TPA: galactokinase family protein [Thermoleophilaceae bacterium]